MPSLAIPCGKTRAFPATGSLKSLNACVKMPARIAKSDLSLGPDRVYLSFKRQ
jgi:hypothetical protein